MQINNIQTKVIIIGAGPAGAGASIFLTKAGIDHVVIEKDTFPRDKICGDSCGGRTAKVLRKANPAWLQEIFRQSDNFMPNYGFEYISPGPKILSVPWSKNKNQGELSPGFLSTRLVFDNYLFEKMPSPYATIFQGAAVKNIERQDDTVKVTFTKGKDNYEVTAPLIVGADGDKSQVRKTFLSNDYLSAKSEAVGLRAYYSGIAGLHKENYIELHYIPEILPGYFWIFPLPNGMANVGLGIVSDAIRKKKINLREAMMQAIENNPNIKNRFTTAAMIGKIQGWGLPMNVSDQPVSGDNFLLAGDAATLVDALSGEGIGNALFSGMLSAEAIALSLEARDHKAGFLEKSYDAILFKHLRPELRMASRLQKLAKYPKLVDFMVNKAHSSPTLHKTLCGMFTDINLKEELRKPLFMQKY